MIGANLKSFIKPLIEHRPEHKKERPSDKRLLVHMWKDEVFITRPSTQTDLIVPQIFVGCNVSGTPWPWFSETCTHYVALSFGCVIYICLPAGRHERGEEGKRGKALFFYVQFSYTHNTNTNLQPSHLMLHISLLFLFFLFSFSTFNPQRCSMLFIIAASLLFIFYLCDPRWDWHDPPIPHILSSLLLCTLPSRPLSLSHASHHTLITSSN